MRLTGRNHALTTNVAILTSFSKHLPSPTKTSLASSCAFSPTESTSSDVVCQKINDTTPVPQSRKRLIPSAGRNHSCKRLTIETGLSGWIVSPWFIVKPVVYSFNLFFMVGELGAIVWNYGENNSSFLFQSLKIDKDWACKWLGLFLIPYRWFVLRFSTYSNVLA